MAAAPSATVSDPPPKPPPDKPLPDNPRCEKTVIQLPSVTATDLGQSSQPSSPTNGGSSLMTGNIVLQPASMASKQRPDLFSNQSLSMAAVGQTSKSSSPVTDIHLSATGILNPVDKGKKSMTFKPSFADAARNGSSVNKRKSEPIVHIFGQPPPLPGAKIISEKGVDILVFEDEATDLLSASLKWALVGKFSHNLPLIHTVGKFFSNLKLRGEFELKWLSHRQMLITLTEEEDYAFIWTKGLWLIDGCQMRTLKWTPIFNTRTECPLAPVWVSLPGLPVHLFEKRALHLLASQLGRPVMVDNPTATRNRFTLARICVEINLLIPLKKVITLRINDHVIEQPVIYEEVPSYCVHCRHIGHAEDQCFIKYKDLKSVYAESQAEKKRKIKGKNKLELVVMNNFSGPSAEANGLDLEVGVVSTVPNNNSGDVGFVGPVAPANVLGLHVTGKGACISHKDEDISGCLVMQSESQPLSAEGVNEVVIDVVVDDVAVHAGISELQLMQGDMGSMHGEFEQSSLLHVVTDEPAQMLLKDLKANNSVHELVEPNTSLHGKNEDVAMPSGNKSVHAVMLPDDDGSLRTDDGHAKVLADVAVLIVKSGTLSGTEDVAMHSEEQLLIYHAGVDSDISVKSADNLNNPGNNNLFATAVDNLTGISPLHATDDGDVTMQSPGMKMLVAEDDAIMTNTKVHPQSDLAKVDGPYSAGPLALPMKPIFQFNPARVTNGHADVLQDDIFRVSGVMPAEFPKQLVLSPFQTSNIFTKPLKTIYPDGSVLVNNANYPNACVRRDFFDHESPRSDLSNDESSGYNEMDDIDDDFGDRPFHRTCSYPNLNDYKKAEYGGRITRSMARNGNEKV